MRNLSFTLVLLFASLTGVALVRAESSPTSKFTSTARGKALSFKTFEKEAGGFEGLFPGLGGYQVEHASGDDRSWLNLRFGGKKTDLYAATMAAAPSGFPRKANDVVEWRGIEKDGRFTPYAIIYRMEGTNEETQKTKSRLIVIKLDKENSSIIGQAEGAGEDAKAKAIADTARPR